MPSLAAMLCLKRHANPSFPLLPFAYRSCVFFYCLLSCAKAGSGKNFTEKLLLPVAQLSLADAAAVANERVSDSHSWFSHSPICLWTENRGKTVYVTCEPHVCVWPRKRGDVPELFCRFAPTSSAVVVRSLRRLRPFTSVYHCTWWQRLPCNVLVFTLAYEKSTTVCEFLRSVSRKGV